MFVNRGARGLNDEDIRAADVLVDLKGDFGIRESMETGGAHGDAEVSAISLASAGCALPEKIFSCP
jgi:hypothetical protein